MARLGAENESRWYSVQEGTCNQMPDTPEDVVRQAIADGATIQPAPNNTKGTIEGYHVVYRGHELNLVFIKGLKGCRLMVHIAETNHQTVP
jgi:hypothetical protein